jgi:hypothetical protein
MQRHAHLIEPTDSRIIRNPARVPISTGVGFWLSLHLQSNPRLIESLAVA